RVVVDIEEVAARVAVAVDRQRLTGERLRDEAWDHLLRVLARGVVVERADEHDREPVRDVGRGGEAAGPRSRGRARGSQAWGARWEPVTDGRGAWDDTAARLSLLPA